MSFMQREPAKPPSLLITFAVSSLGGLIFGYDTGIMALARNGVLATFNIDPNNSYISGFVTSIILFGAMFGSFVAGILASRLGRRLTGYIAAGICLFGGITSAFSVDLASFMILRFVLGIGVGLVGVLCPLYVSEAAPPEYKGKFGVAFQLMLTLGILLSYIVGYGLNQMNDKYLAWRIMLGTGGGLFAIALMIIFFMAAVETASIKSPEKQETQHLVAGTDNKKRGGALGLISLEKLPQTLTGICLAATLQLTGINAIMYYGPIIIQEANFGNPDMINIGIGVWNFLTTFTAAILVDRLGRKMLMVGGTAIMSVALIVVGICLSDVVPKEGVGRPVGVAIGLAIFIAGFEGGAGCLFWVLANEVFDEDVREAGASTVNVLQWGFNLIVSSLFPVMFTGVGQASTFYIFGGIGVVCTVILWFRLHDQPRS